MLAQAYGYLMAVLGKLFGTLSYLFMKMANHKVEEEKKKTGKKINVYLTVTWIIGFAAVIVGSILNLVALPFCGLVLFSTTVGISIVFNNAIAIWYLGEKIIWKYDAPAFLLVVGGSTAIVLLSAENDESYTPARVKELIESLGTLIFVVISVVLLFLALFSLRLLIAAAKDFEEDVHTWVQFQVK